MTELNRTTAYTFSCYILFICGYKVAVNIKRDSALCTRQLRVLAVA